MGKIFYAVNGVGATTTLINVNHFNLQASCTGSITNLEANTTVNESIIHFFGSAGYAEDDDLDTGDTFGITGADNAQVDLTYANPLGELVTMTGLAEQDANSTLTNVDCLVVGTYSAL